MLRCFATAAESSATTLMFLSPPMAPMEATCIVKAKSTLTTPFEACHAAHVSHQSPSLMCHTKLNSEYANLEKCRRVLRVGIHNVRVRVHQRHEPLHSGDLFSF